MASWGGGSSERGTQGQSTLSLGPIGAAQLFGVGTGSAPGGGLTLEGGPAFLPRAFNPAQFSSLGNLANPQAPFLGQDVFRTIGSQAGQSLTGILPQIQQLQETGFGDEIANLSKFLFENDIAPGLEEQFGSSLGLDTGDSDTRAALIREGQRTSFEAANQGVQNRILGLQMGLEAPQAVAGGAGAVEQLLQQGFRQSQPEGQLLDLLMTLGGVNTQAGSVGTSRGRTQGDTGILWGK